jgi:hypothetical protein
LKLQRLIQPHDWQNLFYWRYPVLSKIFVYSKTLAKSGLYAYRGGIGLLLGVLRMGADAKLARL